MAVVIDQSLRRVAMVVPRHPAQPLATFDLAYDLPDLISGIDDLVVESPMNSFMMIMREILANGVSQHVLAEEDHSVQTYILAKP